MIIKQLHGLANVVSSIPPHTFKMLKIACRFSRLQHELTGILSFPSVDLMRI